MIIQVNQLNIGIVHPPVKWLYGICFDLCAFQFCHQKARAYKGELHGFAIKMRIFALTRRIIRIFNVCIYLEAKQVTKHIAVTCPSRLFDPRHVNLVIVSDNNSRQRQMKSRMTTPPETLCVKGNTMNLSQTPSRKIATVYPKKYAHGFVVLCFVVVMQSFIMNSHEVFIHIHQGCFAGTGAIVRLPQCQWSKPDGYGKTSQCITTTKHSKAKTVCTFLRVYCIIKIYCSTLSYLSIT